MKFTGIIKSAVLILLAAITLTSCGEKPTGWGVLLWWDQDTTLTEGNIYPVYSESNIRDTYILTEADSPVVEIPRWKMDLFEKEAEAEQFAEDYSLLIRTYGESLKNGQAIRQDTAPDSERLYKLRENQIVKIVAKTEPKVKIGSAEDYWYRVLTDDGVSGYCFGANLEIFDMDERLAALETLEIDPLITDFLSKPFRPEEFRKMYLENRIDLHRFNPEIGTFPNLEERRVNVVTEEETFIFDFDEIKEGEPGRFIFGDSGLDIKVINPNRIVVHYNDKGASVDQLYVVVDGMENIIEREKERQAELFEELYYMGPAVSSAYGTISFERGTEFFWENYDRLVPEIITPGLDGTGLCEIGIFPSTDIKNQFEGVITLNFQNFPEPYSVNFFYDRLETGLKLTHIPDRDIKDGIVQRVNASPLIMFFSADSPRERDPEESN